MAETDFIVAIELGSSKITGMAGKKKSDGSIYVLAYASEDSSSFIRKGVIYNLNKTAQSLTSIINKLEGILDATIAKVYVGIGGQSLRTVKNTVVRRLDGENEITEELVAEINDENTAVPLVDLEILDAVPQEYRIGNNFQTDPVGVLSNHIEGRFLNIIARDSVKSNLERCFEQAKIEVADYFISPLVTADVVLSDAEKRSGCALVDLGADTTTVSVYKKNILRHLTVLPIGGNSITRDICNLKMEEAEAEHLKQKYGSAVNEPKQEGEELQTIELNDKRVIEEQVLNDIVEARAEEIVANVWNQIQMSGYDTQLLAGIILTGGGANLRNLEDIVRKRTKIEKVKTVHSVLQGVKGGEPDMIRNDGTCNTVLGLLFAGEENCCKPEEPKPLGTLFGEDTSTETGTEAVGKNPSGGTKPEKPVGGDTKKPKSRSFFSGLMKGAESVTKTLFDDEDK